MRIARTSSAAGPVAAAKYRSFCWGSRKITEPAVERVSSPPMAKMLARTLSRESVEASLSAESRSACSLAGANATRFPVASSIKGVERKFIEPPVDAGIHLLRYLNQPRQVAGSLLRLLGSGSGRWPTFDAA